MANTLVLAKNYVANLDEVYKLASVTSGLTAAPEIARAGANVNEIIIPQMEVSGLGDYDRNSGYTTGAVELDWVTKKLDYDRGTKILVDTMDDQETFNLAFGMAGAELMRTRISPEADAYTFAKLAGVSGISTATPATYADGEAFLTALLYATDVMDEDEVPDTDRWLFSTPTLLNSLMALDSYKSKEVLTRFSSTVRVPQTRFYTAIDLLDGKTAGEEAGHYKKATTGKDINFMIIHKPALIKYDKHVVSNVIAPADNPDYDAYLLKYRKYSMVEVFDNKKAGIYISNKA